MSNWNNRASWAAAVALAVGVSSGASAADLGGNCCADLEERIAELEATTARKGNRKVSLEISGWINKTILFWDDSVRNDVYAGIDNDAAQSRFRFTGAATISPDIRAGFVYEFGQHGSQTSFVDQSNGGDDGGFGPQQLRHANVWIESKRLGRVTLGLASQATDGIAEIDLSRTEAVSGSNVSAWNASFKSNFSIPSLLPGVNFYYFPVIEHFGGNFDGGRDQLIRWDSPAFGGFQLAASVSLGGSADVLGNDYTEWDVALRYAAEFNGFRFASGVGFHRGINRDSSNQGVSIGPGGAPGGLPTDVADFNWVVPVDTIVGSAALLHVPSGFFLSAAAGHVAFDDAVFDGNKYSYLYAKSGFLRNWFAMGQTSIYAEYYQYRFSPGAISYDFLGDGFTSHVYGAGIVQHIDAAAMEVYLAYRLYDSPDINFLGVLPLEFGDIHMVQAGMRIRF